MSKPLSREIKGERIFKDYLMKLAAVNRTTVISQEDALACYCMAAQKLNLMDAEEKLLAQLKESKIDISRNENVRVEESKIDISYGELLVKYNKMVECLNRIAQWDDELDESDEPFAASTSRRVLEDVGEVLKRIPEVCRKGETQSNDDLF